MKILVMGLPGSGKSTFSEKLMLAVGSSRDVDWFNADDIRSQSNDWDFSSQGRMRQCLRMKQLADTATEKHMVSISDFVCPTRELRKAFDPDLVIWMDTIKESRYLDTNQLFETPSADEYDFRITDYSSITSWATTIADLVDVLTTVDPGEWVK